MVKAIWDASLPDLGCFAHTLQLVVNDGVLSQRAVIDLLSTSKKIVEHFRQSCLATSRIKDIQLNLGLPQHHLIQDEPTRWNSTLYMMKRIVEQKMALGAYAMEYTIPQFTSYQLDLANKVINVLSSVEEITQSISASIIILFIQILFKTLSQDNDDIGVHTMKAEMKSSLTRRYAEENEKLTIATILDPRFKDNFFYQSKNSVKALVREKCCIDIMHSNFSQILRI